MVVEHAKKFGIVNVLSTVLLLGLLWREVAHLLVVLMVRWGNLPWVRGCSLDHACGGITWWLVWSSLWLRRLLDLLSRRNGVWRGRCTSLVYRHHLLLHLLGRREAWLAVEILRKVVVLLLGLKLLLLSLLVIKMWLSLTHWEIRARRKLITNRYCILRWGPLLRRQDVRVWGLYVRRDERGRRAKGLILWGRRTLVLIVWVVVWLHI